MLTMRRITFYNVIDLFVEIDFSLPLSLSLSPSPRPTPALQRFQCVDSQQDSRVQAGLRPGHVVSSPLMHILQAANYLSCKTKTEMEN